LSDHEAAKHKLQNLFDDRL
jgi:chromosome segregation ATPase